MQEKLPGWGIDRTKTGGGDPDWKRKILLFYRVTEGFGHGAKVFCDDPKGWRDKPKVFCDGAKGWRNKPKVFCDGAKGWRDKPKVFYHAAKGSRDGFKPFYWRKQPQCPIVEIKVDTACP